MRNLPGCILDIKLRKTSASNLLDGIGDMIAPEYHVPLMPTRGLNNNYGYKLTESALVCGAPSSSTTDITGIEYRTSARDWSSLMPSVVGQYDEAAYVGERDMSLFIHCYQRSINRYGDNPYTVTYDRCILDMTSASLTPYGYKVSLYYDRANIYDGYKSVISLSAPQPDGTTTVISADTGYSGSSIIHNDVYVYMLNMAWRGTEEYDAVNGILRTAYEVNLYCLRDDGSLWSQSGTGTIYIYSMAGIDVQGINILNARQLEVYRYQLYNRALRLGEVPLLLSHDIDYDTTRVSSNDTHVVYADMDREAYDALESKNADTLYLVQDGESLEMYKGSTKVDIYYVEPSPQQQQDEEQYNIPPTLDGCVVYLPLQSDGNDRMLHDVTASGALEHNQQYAGYSSTAFFGLSDVSPLVVRTTTSVPMADADSLEFAESDFTISLWVCNQKMRRQSVLMEQGYKYAQGGYAVCYGLSLEDGRFVVYTEDRRYVGNTVLEDTGWHHVVASVRVSGPRLEGSAPRTVIYLDGAWFDTLYGAYCTTNIPEGYRTQGGISIASPLKRRDATALSGYMREFRIYRRALNALEVIDIYNESRNEENIQPLTSTAQHLHLTREHASYLWDLSQVTGAGLLTCETDPSAACVWYVDIVLGAANMVELGDMFDVAGSSNLVNNNVNHCLVRWDGSRAVLLYLNKTQIASTVAEFDVAPFGNVYTFAIVYSASDDFLLDWGDGVSQVANAGVYRLEHTYKDASRVYRVVVEDTQQFDNGYLRLGADVTGLDLSDMDVNTVAAPILDVMRVSGDLELADPSHGYQWLHVLPLASSRLIVSSVGTYYVDVLFTYAGDITWPALGDAESRAVIADLAPYVFNHLVITHDGTTCLIRRRPSTARPTPNDMVRTVYKFNVASMLSTPYNFYGCRHMNFAESFTLPADCGTDVADAVFCGCESLTNLQLPSGVYIEKIGTAAFYNCGLLQTNVYYITNVGAYGCCGCSSLSGTLPLSSSAVVGSHAFCDCTNIDLECSYRIPMHDYAYARCVNSFSRHLVEVMSAYSTTPFCGVFYGCSKLYARLPVGSQAAAVGPYFFYQCGTVDFRNNDDIAASLFGAYSFAGIRQFRFYDTLALGATADANRGIIPPYVFTGTRLMGGASSVNKIQIPYSRVTIEEYAFADTYGNKLVVYGLPGGAFFSVLDHAFQNSSIELFARNGDNHRIVQIGDAAFSSCTELTELCKISATSIASNAFRGCTNLTTVQWVDTVIINDHAFNGCVKLAVEVHARSIGAYAFAACRSIATSVYADTIGEYAFYGACMITAIQGSYAGLSSIGDLAFANPYRTSVDQLTLDIYGDRLQIGANAFRAIYQTLPGIVNIHDSVRSIAETAFAENPGMSLLCLPTYAGMIANHESRWGLTENTEIRDNCDGAVAEHITLIFNPDYNGISGDYELDIRSASVGRLMYVKTVELDGGGTLVYSLDMNNGAWNFRRTCEYYSIYRELVFTLDDVAESADVLCDLYGIDQGRTVWYKPFYYFPGSGYDPRALWLLPLVDDGAVPRGRRNSYETGLCILRDVNYKDFVNMELIIAPENMDGRSLNFRYINPPSSSSRKSYIWLSSSPIPTKTTGSSYTFAYNPNTDSTGLDSVSVRIAWVATANGGWTIHTSSISQLLYMHLSWYSGRNVPEDAFQWCTNLTTDEFALRDSIRVIDARAFQGCSRATFKHLPSVDLLPLRTSYEGTSIGAYAFSSYYVNGTDYPGPTLDLGDQIPILQNVGTQAFSQLRTVAYAGFKYIAIIGIVSDGALSGYLSYLNSSEEGASTTLRYITPYGSSLTSSTFGGEAGHARATVQVPDVGRSIQYVDEYGVGMAETPVLECRIANNTSCSFRYSSEGLGPTYIRTTQGIYQNASPATSRIAGSLSGTVAFFNNEYGVYTSLVAYSLKTNIIAVTELDGGQLDTYSAMFKGCTGIERIRMYDVFALANNTDEMLSGCTSLRQIQGTAELPAFSTASNAIGGSMFAGCSLLECLPSLPDSIETIGSYAFDGCATLACFTVPASVTTIGTAAFRNCASMATVVFKGPSIPSSIATDAFSGCTALTSIKVPWSEGAVEGAPWGAPNGSSIVTYDHVYDSEEDACATCDPPLPAFVFTVTVDNDSRGLGGTYTRDMAAGEMAAQEFSLDIVDFFLQDPASTTFGQLAIYKDSSNLWYMASLEGFAPLILLNLGQASGFPQDDFPTVENLVEHYTNGAAAYNADEGVDYTVTMRT